MKMIAATAAGICQQRQGSMFAVAVRKARARQLNLPISIASHLAVSENTCLCHIDDSTRVKGSVR